MDLKKRRVQRPETRPGPRGEVRRRGNQPQSMRRACSEGERELIRMMTPKYV